MILSAAILSPRSALLLGSARLTKNLIPQQYVNCICNGRRTIPSSQFLLTTPSRNIASTSRHIATSRTSTTMNKTNLTLDAKTKNRINTHANTHETKTLYLHVSPDGDWWTGYELFAAKHLQPDYVKSVVLPDTWLADKDADYIEIYIQEMYDSDELEKLMREIYDTGSLPSRVLDK